MKRDPKKWLFLKRTVRFGETDSAGVVHFLEGFKWCHESWEESLEKFGIVLHDIFPSTQINISQPDVALPVVSCEASYFQPLYVGDSINVELYPEKINDSSFILRFKFKKKGEEISHIKIKHVCINRITREKCSLSKPLDLWLEESNLFFNC